MKNNILISVHLPKTAGSSFKKTLELHYGKGFYPYYKGKTPIRLNKLELHFDSLRMFVNNVFKKYENIKCIHGHFLPFKYKSLSVRNNVTFITWMRNPVDRLLSHYHYIKRMYNKGENNIYLWDKIIKEKWSFEQFAFCEEVKNFYSQYLWNFDVDNFDFIGITEFYDEDIKYFMNKYWNKSVDTFKENVNKNSRNNYVISDELRSKIEEYHAEDMKIYKKALKSREKRLGLS